MAAPRLIRVLITAIDRASPVFAKIAASMAALGALAGVVGAVQIGRKLASGIAEATRAAAKFETATVGLQVALSNQGQNTAAARKDLLDFAKALTEASLATETQIISALAQAKAMGASSEAAKDLARAATDLAASGLVDQDTAFRQLTKTLGGYAGELGELIPALKELSAEQLRAGGAAAVVSSQFQGAGEAGARTFQGAVNNLNSALEQLRVEVGGPFRDVFRELINKVLLPATKALTALISKSGTLRLAVLDLGIAFAKVGELLESTFRKFGPTLLLLALQQAAKAKASLDLLAGALEKLGFRADDTSEFFRAFREELEALKDGAKELDLGNVDGKGLEQDVEVVSGRLLSAYEAVNDFLFYGVRNFQNYLDATLDEVESFSRTIRLAVGGALIDSALDFGATLADAFIDGKDAFEDFFKEVLRGLARAIAQALVLRAILSFGGPIARFLGPVLSSAGAGPSEIPKAATGIPVPDLEKALRTPAPIEIILRTDVPTFVKNVNQGVRDGLVRVYATDLQGAAGNIR